MQKEEEIMDEKYRPAYDVLKEKYNRLQNESIQIQNKIRFAMEMINGFLVEIGDDPEFKGLPAEGGMLLTTMSITTPNSGGSQSVISHIEIGQFIHTTLARAVREIINLNGGKPMLFDDIAAALQQGGHPKAKNQVDAKRARKTIMKNTAMFFFQQPDYFGLKDRAIVKRQKRAAKVDTIEQKKEVEKEKSTDAEK
jgi:hypothetical protein